MTRAARAARSIMPSFTDCSLPENVQRAHSRDWGLHAADAHLHASVYRYTRARTPRPSTCS
eukprot:4914697-Pyramimonas_sp.AAC.1